MGGTVVSEQQLLGASWRELRSEVAPWDREDTDTEGYDGFSRFWCPEAVFDVYWVAERISTSEVALYLTSDMLLTGFKAPLPFAVTGEYLVSLAKKIHWERVATLALRSALEAR